MTQPRRSYVDVAGGQLHFREHGRGLPGVPWVLLHHSASTSDSLTLLAEELSATRPVYALDTPGFGGSDPVSGPVSVESLADAIVQGLRGLGLVQWSLFGHHTGASIAVKIASQYPEMTSDAVLSGFLLPIESDSERMVATSTPLPFTPDGNRMMAAWKRCQGFTPDAPLERIEREAIAVLQAWKPHETYDALLRYSPVSDLRNLQCKVVVTGGEHDLLSARIPEVLALLKNGSSAVVAGGRLDMPETHAMELAQIMNGEVAPNDATGEVQQ